MNIEEAIRSRIEAILVHDARSYSDLREMASKEEPLEAEAFEEERNLYQRIINNYRNAVSHVNRLLEENVGYLSGFFRIVENIRERGSFQEICARIADSVLQDFGAEYCSIFLLDPADADEKVFCVEGTREERKILRIHSDPTMLGSAEFAGIVERIATDSLECLKIEDVYRDERFNSVDFPSVVRSLVFLPLTHRRQTVGAMVLGHSQPRFFTDNQIRVLRILASMISHIRLLTHLHQRAAHRESPGVDLTGAAAMDDLYSVALLCLERTDTFGRPAPPDRNTLCLIRKRLAAAAGPGVAIFCNGEGELIVLLPGVGTDSLPARICTLREAFFHWRSEQRGPLAAIRLNVGFATCEEGENLMRTLEVASLFLHPETDTELDVAAEL